ncbi:MAG: hypothetical protein A2114_02725 [Candidatus Vogelbacteria bacterium GWA1_51_14]|uniref:Glycosyl transferase family 1 domain-containing protein n=1 Tax=Candidatus Vogelbacteria bacterium GWA1_51_14 TaxID=1802435 RepID=A0A1G2Q9N9_9BACT|nr:MAG: hypothetical protein A2114_02725 [Candidatus Vogelbacteria bacterium GWA1_51_14]
MSNYRKIKVALMSYAMDNRLAKGTAIYTRELIKHLLDDDRFEFTLVHYDQVADDLYNQAGHAVIMPNTFYSSRWLRQLKWFWQWRHTSFDIIHWFQPRLYPGYWWAPARHKVVTIHGGGQFYYPWYSFTARIFDWILKFFNQAISLAIVGTRQSLVEAITTYGLPATKLVTTYYGGSENFKPLPSAEALAIIKQRYPMIGREFILTVSRLQPHKNINNLIRGYLKLRTDPNIQLQLVIIAQPTEQYQTTYRLARESDYAADIIFIDYVPTADLNYFYSAASVFVFSSLSEGFGLPVVEAMAAGTPVAISNIPVLTEIASEAGNLFSAHDPADIAQVLGRLITNPELAKVKRELGLDRAKLFTWAKTATATKEAYLNLLSHD